MHELSSKPGPALAAWLYRPYLDLGPLPPRPPFHVTGIEFGYRALVDGGTYPRIQAALNASFRDVLIRTTGAVSYGIERPTDLPPTLRTPWWERMCRFVEDFDDLEPEQQVLLAWLLSKLCFYRFVGQLLPESIDEQIHDSCAIASLAYLRALARYRLRLDDAAASYSIDEFERVALQAPPGLARIDAHYQMVAQNVKQKNNLVAAEHWQPLHLRAIDNSRRELDDFTYIVVMSRYHRVGGFLPQMRQQRDEVVREMTLAEEYARALPRETAIMAIGADEMLYPVLESRMKEALWLGDLALAEERAAGLVELSPHDPRAWLHLGEARLERDDVSGALEAYRQSARYAPPGLEVASFMAGQCLEELGDPQGACDAYLTAMKEDALGISSAECLESVAERIGAQTLLAFARARLAGIRQIDRAPTEDEPYKHLPPPLEETAEAT
jgi:tetratricopeptide (TPR) repeat protein